jgi:hypothetical protein
MLAGTPIPGPRLLPSPPDHRVLAAARQRATIQAVKAYRIERIKGGMKFICTHCAHSVSTLDFDAKAGNLRTQAATAINDHATKAHREPLVVSASEGQQRTWR